MSEWLNNDKATDRVKELLIQAGFPLEIRVEQICRDFVNSHKEKFSTISFSSGQIIYGGRTLGEAPREVDQSIVFRTNIEIGRNIVIQLRLKIPIECKYRDNLEIFGLPYLASLDRALVSYPILTSLLGSRLISRIEKAEPSIIKPEPFSVIALLDIESGKTPKKVHQENLVYNAGAALYDYIKYDADPMSSHDIWSIAKDSLEQSELDKLDQLYKQFNLKSNLRYKWPKVIDFINEQIDIDR